MLARHADQAVKKKYKKVQCSLTLYRVLKGLRVAGAGQEQVRTCKKSCRMSGAEHASTVPNPSHGDDPPRPAGLSTGSPILLAQLRVYIAPAYPVPDGTPPRR